MLICIVYHTVGCDKQELGMLIPGHEGNAKSLSVY
jgi:hypothetical protein